MEVTLRTTPLEEKLFEWLRSFQRSAVDECPSVSDLRVVGGWVRDKLMGMKSNDIDVCLADCTGEEFAHAFVKFVARLHKDLGHINVHQIRANPAKSKHLATAKADFIDLGISIDFVNLRTESYADTRIPTTKFGTPEEDALRRDFTVNALFYNLTSNKIEDWSGSGLDHLKLRILCTPLEPLQTFLDDPLRILRAARFLGKLKGFSPDENLERAAASEKLKKPLYEKVSRDRFLQEIQKCFEAESPFRSLLAFSRWGLWSSIFYVDDFFAPKEEYRVHSVIWRDRKFPNRSALDYINSGDAFKFGLCLCSVLDELIKLIQDEEMTDIISEDCEMFWDQNTFRSFMGRGLIDMSCMLIFHRGHKKTDKRRRPETDDLIYYALMSLNATQFWKAMMEFFRIFEAFLTAFDAVGQQVNNQRAMLAAALTQTKSRDYWELSLMLASIFWELSNHLDADNIHLDINAITFNDSENKLRQICSPEFIRKVQTRILSTKDAIKDHQLDDIWDLRLIFDGKKLHQMFPKLSDGPIMGKALETQRKWMIRNWIPSADSNEIFRLELTKYLNSKFA